MLFAPGVLCTLGCWTMLGLDDKEYVLPDVGAGGTGGQNAATSSASAAGGAGGSTGACGDGPPPPMPVISRNVLAWASLELGDQVAGDANDANYATFWRSGDVPAWLAYDLSSVDPAARQKVVAVFHNGTPQYDHDVTGADAYNLPGSYTIEANAAPGGGPAPTDGWVTLATARANSLHSRQHLVDLAGYNWIRIHTTVSDGALSNADVGLNFDVHDASGGVCDDWIVFGDAATMTGLAVVPPDGDTLASLIHAALPERFPLLENGSMEYWSTDAGRKHVLGSSGWLAAFPGHYVGLAFGWEDAITTAPDPATFRAYMRDLATAVLDAGKVPVVATIPWHADPSVRASIDAMNAEIEALYAEVPQIVRGPDLYAAFEGHAFDNQLWLTAEGALLYRQSWADALVANVYAPQ